MLSHILAKNINNINIGLSMKSMLKQNMISANDSAEWPGGGIEMEEWPAITAVII